MAAIADALALAEGGRGGVVLIEGEAGIGKSRLVDEGVVLARTKGFDVLAAACLEAERTVPFAAATRLVGELASDIGPDDAMSPALQFRLIEALGNVVEATAAGRPVVLALDDLQWADPSTLLAVRSVAGRIERLPVLVLGAFRAGHQVADLHRLVDDLARGGAAVVSVPPLDDDAVTSLVAAVVGAAPSSTLLERVRGAGGNPLYVTEFASMAGGEDDQLPAQFVLTVQRRLGQLPQDVADTLRMASILGSSFSPGDLASALERSTVELAPIIEQSVRAGVAEDRGNALAFRHDLVRQAIYDHIPPALRRALHKEVGERLAKAGAGPLVVAHHLRLGAESIDPDAAAWLLRAARDASHRAPAVAAELLEQARDLLPVSASERIEVLADLVLAYAWAGRLADAISLAPDVLSRPLDPSTATSLRSALVRALSWQGRAADALEQAGLRDDEPLDVPGADLLAAETALGRYMTFDYRGAAEMAERAEAAATASGNALALCQALSVQGWVATFTGRLGEGVELGYRAIAVADASPGGFAHLSHPRFFPGMPLVMLDRLDEADRLLREGRQYAEERGLMWGLPMFYAYLAGKHFAAGEWDAAVAECEAGLTVVGELGLGTPQVLVIAAWLTVIQVHRDELEAADRTIARARDLAGDRPNPALNWAIALLHENRGEIDDAKARLQQTRDLVSRGGGLSDPYTPTSLIRLCVRTGDMARSVALLPVVAQQAEAGTPFFRGQYLRCQGLVHDNPDVLLDAVAEYRQSPRVAELAAVCEDAGEVLARHDRTGEAVPLLEESHQLFEDVGARRDASRLRATMRDLGVRRTGRRRRATAESGWESLTETELTVVELVAQRLSNPEVAERLFISRHTVESHLKHIYRKLGLSSRIELAAAAAARG
jgi:DNA-binding CsgD family transcriptional regulator/tetratricopeptide (TPR) repeat protein